ncbi:MAG: MFS transporter [Novosphingobium sp.]|nr:MFS transporter [Novosphingobium sp.]
MAFNGRLKFVVLGAFSLLHFMLNACTFNGLGVVLPYMVDELGWAWATAGFGFTLLGMACGLSGLVPALLIRRIGVARTMLIGGAVLVTGFACLALTQSALVYFVGTIFLGIGYSICGTVPGVNVISHSFKRSSTPMGIYFTAGGFGAVAGPLIAYATQELTHEWRYYWVGAALSAILLSVFAALVTADRPGKNDEESRKQQIAKLEGWPAKAAMRTVQYYIVVGAYTVFLLINTTVHGFAVKHLSDTGLTMGGAASVMSAIALIGAIGSTVAGLAGEKIGGRELTMLSLSATVLGVLALVAGGNWFAVPVAVVGLGVGFGFSYVGTAMLLLDLFGKRSNLELYSTMSLISTAAAIGPAIGGLVRDELGSFALVFIACAVLGFVFLMALLWLNKPALPQEENEAEPVLAA